MTVAEDKPLWADVVIDGSPAGQTPVTVPLSPGKAHRVVMRRDGFRSATRRVVLKPGQKRTLVVTLRKGDGA